jgi:hypothetical protein
LTREAAGTVRCSSISLAHEEPLIGTASDVRRWLLLEQPGPWGYDATSANRMSRSVAGPIRERTAELGIRLILLRRAAGARTAHGAHCFFAYTGPRRTWLRHAYLEDLTDVLDVDLTPMLGGRPPAAGEPETDPLFLVCTNGSRDPCCAERGRPIARALAPVFGDRVWECSHIGGDRFAGNVVCFPQGVYFGRVAPEEAVALCRRFREGVLDLERFRGVSRYGFAVQAAEILLRRRERIVGVDELLLTGARRRGDVLAVEFAASSGSTFSIRVEIARAPTARRLTCHGTEIVHPPSYEELADR